VYGEKFQKTFKAMLLMLVEMNRQIGAMSMTGIATMAMTMFSRFSW